VAFASRLDVVAIRSSPGFTQLAAEFSRHYLERAGTRSLLYPHVRTTLQALRAAGVKLAVVTNKEARFTERVLDAHQLTHLLDCVVAGDTLSSKKPHPEGVHHCLAACEVAPRHALLVGDSSIDVATARNAGIPVWAVPYGYNMGVPVAVSGPNRIIGDISALLAEVA
jgi:phosphoglycolate phosphatase